MPGADSHRLAFDPAALLANAVCDAGALALTSFRNSPRQWAKGKSSVVCEADILVDDFLRERLAGAAPSYGWLSEETEDQPGRLGAEHVWIVDPHDETVLVHRPGELPKLFTVRDELTAEPQLPGFRTAVSRIFE